MANLTIQDLRKISDEICSKRFDNIKICIEDALEILDRQNPDLELVRKMLKEAVIDDRTDDAKEKFSIT